MRHFKHANKVTSSTSCNTACGKWVTAHMRMSHVTHMNVSRHTCAWVTSHVWIRHVPHESHHMHEYVTSLTSSNAACGNESRHKYDGVMSHMCMSHVTHKNESRHTYERITTYMCMSHITCMNTSRHWPLEHGLQKMSHVTHMKASRHTHTKEYVTLLVIYTCDVTRHTYKWGYITLPACRILFEILWEQLIQILWDLWGIICAKLIRQHPQIDLHPIPNWFRSYPKLIQILRDLLGIICAKSI